MSTPTIHKRQLFHWIGGHIEHGPDRLTGQERVKAYVECLRASITDGLWLTPKGEVLEIAKRSYRLERRMACFTENRLSECRFHSTRYGRLGLGFPKRFVLQVSGKPVSYVQNRIGDLYTTTLLKLLEATAKKTGADDLDFLAHFVKPLGDKRGARKATSSAPRGAAVPAGPPGADVIRRQFGPKMVFQSEGEWRVVEDFALLKRKRGGARRLVWGAARTLLPYRPGADLMTIVFPDAATQQAAQNDPVIGPAVANAVPPVNVFHLDEISEL